MANIKAEVWREFELGVDQQQLISTLRGQNVKNKNEARGMAEKHKTTGQDNLLFCYRYLNAMAFF